MPGVLSWKLRLFKIFLNKLGVQIAGKPLLQQGSKTLKEAEKMLLTSVTAFISLAFLVDFLPQLWLKLSPDLPTPKSNKNGKKGKR